MVWISNFFALSKIMLWVAWVYPNTKMFYMGTKKIYKFQKNFMLSDLNIFGLKTYVI